MPNTYVVTGLLLLLCLLPCWTYKQTCQHASLVEGVKYCGCKTVPLPIYCDYERALVERMSEQELPFKSWTKAFWSNSWVWTRAAAGSPNASDYVVDWLCCKWISVPYDFAVTRLVKHPRNSKVNIDDKAWDITSGREGPFRNGLGDESYWVKPFELTEKACSFHLRNWGVIDDPLQIQELEVECSMPGQCQTACCCAVESESKLYYVGAGYCVSPEDCRRRGSYCKENPDASLIPRLRQLKEHKFKFYRFPRIETKERAVSYRWYKRNIPLTYFPKACFKNRLPDLNNQPILGKAAIVHLGRKASEEALFLKAYHWSVNYGKSPFKYHMLEDAFFTVVNGIHNMEWSERAEHEESAMVDVFAPKCQAASRDSDEGLWNFLVTEVWEGNPDALHLDQAVHKSKDATGACESPQGECKRRNWDYGRTCKVTFVVTANVDGFVELRTGNMQGYSKERGCGYFQTMMDAASKHFFLNWGQDYVLWAGEAWLQLKQSVIQDCKKDTNGDAKELTKCLREMVHKLGSESVELIMNNDSGTFKAGDDVVTRLDLANMLRGALGNAIQVCPGPWHSDIEAFANDNACAISGFMYNADVTDTTEHNWRPQIGIGWRGSWNASFS